MCAKTGIEQSSYTQRKTYLKFGCSQFQLLAGELFKVLTFRRHSTFGTKSNKLRLPQGIASKTGYRQYIAMTTPTIPVVLLPSSAAYNNGSALFYKLSRESWETEAIRTKSALERRKFATFFSYSSVYLSSTIVKSTNLGNFSVPGA